MDDCVSRQAAIDYFMINTNWYDEDGDRIEDAEDKRKLLTDYFNGIPSVTPAPRIGRWRDTGSGQECSECGEIQYGYDNFRNYCPNCGARMEVGDADED